MRSRAVRMNLSRGAALAGLALLGLLAWRARADKPAETESRLLKHLKFLAGADCEGRGITTKGINRAADYIAHEFQSAGLKPGGPDGTYFQPFTLTTGGRVGKNCRLALRGPLGQSIALEQGKHFRTSLYGGSGKVDAAVVFAGYGVTATEPKYDDYAGLDVAGKVVVVLNGAPPTSAVPGFPAAAPRGLRGRIVSPLAKIENARAHKAAAVLLVNSRAAIAGLRDSLPRREVLSMRGGDPSPLPAAYLRREWVEKMLPATLGPDLARVEKDIEADHKPRSRPLAGWTCRLETDVTHTKITVKNVIGVLEGGGALSQETVVIGAHYDHMGLGASSPFGGPRPARGGAAGGPIAGPGSPGGVGFPLFQLGTAGVYHGADDNASGSTAVMELARRFGTLKQRSGRRLVFMTFTAEESGLLGSAYYCRAPAFPLKDTVAMLNMDMVGRLQDDKLIFSGLGTAKEFPPLVERLNKKHRFDLLKETTGRGPSDHASFYARDIPVLFLFTGFHEQYHRPTDRVETINVAGLRRVADLAEDVVAELRTMPRRPTFTKNSNAFDRTRTLWSAAPSIGVVPDYTHKGAGVLLEGVVKNTPAERAGLKKGDRLVAISGKPVKDATAFLALARTLPMGTKVEFAVVREGKEQKFGVQLATPPRPRDRRFGYALDLNSPGTGVLVDDVPEGSPAARAGLKKGDRIVALAGKPVPDVTAYANATNELSAGAKVEVAVMRAGKKETFQVQTAAARTRTSTPAARFGVVPDLTNDKDGILLADVRDGSPADEAGLREGDRITALNGKAIKEMRAYTSLLAAFREGDKVEVTVVRNGKTFTLRAVLK